MPFKKYFSATLGVVLSFADEVMPQKEGWLRFGAHSSQRLRPTRFYPLF